MDEIIICYYDVFIVFFTFCELIKFRCKLQSISNLADLLLHFILFYFFWATADLLLSKGLE